MALKEILISSLGIKIAGLIMLFSSIIWALSKKKYDIAIGVGIAAAAYIVIVFVFLGVQNV